MIYIEGKRRGLVSRLIYSAYKEPPGNLCVLHTCDNPGCINPEHLFLGTMSDNTQDMINKGRHRVPRGEANPRVTVSDAVVAAIRAESPQTSNKELCLKYNVKAAFMSAIRNYKSRKEVSPVY